MTRSEFYAAFREARKLRQLERAFNCDIDSLADVIPFAAYTAACRYGDALQWSHIRMDGKWRSRVR